MRETSEWDAGHAPGARHLALGSLAGALGTLAPDVDIVVVCRSGNRSARATELLIEAGLDAVNLKGGMVAWAAVGLPVLASDGGPGTVG